VFGCGKLPHFQRGQNSQVLRARYDRLSLVYSVSSKSNLTSDRGQRMRLCALATRFFEGFKSWPFIVYNQRLCEKKNKRVREAGISAPTHNNHFVVIVTVQVAYSLLSPATTQLLQILKLLSATPIAPLQNLFQTPAFAAVLVLGINELILFPVDHPFEPHPKMIIRRCIS
jgi:hypothetical protein